MVDALPTVQSLKFTTLGRNSLLNRISDPLPSTMSANYEEQLVDDLEDSYVDMDVDDVTPSAPEAMRTEPALLSRLDRRIDSSSPSSIPDIFHPDGTFTPPLINGAFLPTMTQSMESETSTQHAVEATVARSSGYSIPIAQPSLGVVKDLVTQSNGDSYVKNTSHAIFSGPTLPESIAPSSNAGSLTSSLHISASMPAVGQSDDVTLSRAEPLASPSRTSGVPGSLFELLQEEKAAWSEVLEKKWAQQAEVQSSSVGRSVLSQQASSSTVPSAEVPAQLNVDRNSSQESIPSLPMFPPSPMLGNVVQDHGRTVAEGPPSLSTHHQTTVIHAPGPGSPFMQPNLPSSSVYKGRDFLPTISTTKESSLPPSEPTEQILSIRNDISPNARLLHAPRGDDNVTPGKRKSSSSPLPAPDKDDIHQALKRQRAMSDAPTNESDDSVRKSVVPTTSAPDQLSRSTLRSAISAVDSLAHGAASLATSSFSTPTSGEKRPNTSQLTIAKAEEVDDSLTIAALLPPPAQVKKEEDEDFKARVKLDEDSKAGIKKEGEKPFAIASTSSNIPLKAPKNEEDNPSFNVKEGNPTPHSADGLAEAVSGGRSGDSRDKPSSESPGNTPGQEQARVPPQDEHCQGDHDQDDQQELPVQKGVELREPGHRHVAQDVSDVSLPPDIGHAVHVSQAAFPGEYHERADVQEEPAGPAKVQSVPFSQNQADAPDDSTVSMSISPLATPAIRIAELDVQPVVVSDSDSQELEHGDSRDHRSLSNEMQHRQPSFERPLRFYDHWSPTPSPAPSPRSRYRPHSPSPERLGPRLRDTYRPAYSRNRTPPRFPWRVRDRMPGSPTYSESAIRRNGRPEVTRIGQRPSHQDPFGGGGPVAPRTGAVRRDTPPYAKSCSPSNAQQSRVELNNLMPPPSSPVAAVVSSSSKDDQKMDPDRRARNVSHERQLIPNRQRAADHEPIRQELPKPRIEVAEPAVSTVTQGEARPHSTFSPSFPQNSVSHSNANPQAVPNTKIIAPNVAQAKKSSDRVTDKSPRSLLASSSPGIRQEEAVTRLQPATSSTKSPSLVVLRDNHIRVGRDGDTQRIASADAKRVRETELRENGRVEDPLSNLRPEQSSRKIPRERAYPPEASETPLIARISWQKMGSVASNENNQAEVMTTDSDMHTERSSSHPLNSHPLPELKDRVGVTYATSNATRRPDSDASSPAQLASRIGSVLNISETDALPMEAPVIMPLSLRISGAPPRSQRPAHPLPPKPSVSHNEDGSERSDKRGWLERPQATNEPVLLGRMRNSGKENGSRRLPQKNSLATRNVSSGQEHAYASNVFQAKKRPLEKRLS